MRITELFTAQSIALDEALTDQEQILSRLAELQGTHGNITDKDAYKKALYAREAEGSTYVDNGITVPHAKTNVVTRPSLAALRLSSPVQYNAEDDGTTDLLFAIAAPENGSLHVDMLARMMQMLMNEDFVEKLKTAKTPAEFLDCIDAQEEAQFGAESFTQQEIPQSGYRILAVTACVNGIAHTYMAAEALTKAGDKLGLPTKVRPMARTVPRTSSPEKRSQTAMASSWRQKRRWRPPALTASRCCSPGWTMASTSRRSSSRRSCTARCLFTTPRAAHRPPRMLPARTALAAPCTRT